MTDDSAKLREPKARDIVLRIAVDLPNHRASTSQIKALVPKYHKLSPEDMKPSKTRPNEHMWEQIIGNVTGSHQNSTTSIFNRGLATRTEDGIQVTNLGFEYLVKKGYLE